MGGCWSGTGAWGGAPGRRACHCSKKQRMGGEGPCAGLHSEAGQGGTFRQSRALFAAMQAHARTGRGKPRNYAVLAILALIASACASVPNAGDDIAEATTGALPSPLVLGSDGLLNVAQSSRLLDSVAGGSARDPLLERHLRIEQAIAGTPLTAGNATE